MIRWNLSYLIILIFFGCQSSDSSVFELLDSKSSGITFSNTIAISDSLNALVFEYVYNGAGIGVADFDKDGLMDLFFAGNQIPSQVYLNKGSLKFEDITLKTGINTKNIWCTGVSIVDINQDSYPDIYLSVAGYSKEETRNLLYVNQGDLSFKEEAKKYGIDDPGYGTQAVFFDYDRDGDLDLYVLNNALENFNRGNIKPKVLDGSAKSNDKLYRNEGDGNYIDVTFQAGILKEGWGLGVSVSDLNGDGWPDIYVSNDFLSNDLMYINQTDGTFADEINSRVSHQTFNGMGNDVADYNNDGWTDIVVMDMLPMDNYREKMMLMPASYNQFQMSLLQGYQPQYVRNTLQLNQGGVFSEIGQLAGIAKTDWSWASLFADFDLDGNKDLFITNGYRKDVTNLDYIVYTQSESAFGTKESNKRDIISEMNNLEGVKLHNFLFQNQGDLTFRDQSLNWGLELETFSNGAVYADLDNDGDLELVTNNIDQEASLFKNNSIENSIGNSSYIRINLEGPPGNLEAIGAKIWIKTANGIQMLEKSPVRGYKSSVDPRLIFGVKRNEEIDLLLVQWPDGNYQSVDFPDLNTEILVKYQPNQSELPSIISGKGQTYFEETNIPGLDFRHVEDDFNDFEVQGALPRKFSQDGPTTSTGDLNGDGLLDIFIGGSAGLPASIYLQDQQANFHFEEFDASIPFHDASAVIMDANGDHYQDLVVASGGSQFEPGSSRYFDRLYLGNKDRGFEYDSTAFPLHPNNTSVIKAGDIDLDGDMDLIVGGGVLPGYFPLAADTYILINQSGKFSRKEIELKSIAKKIGIVRDLELSDINKDGYLDLLIAEEWGKVRIFLNHNGQLKESDFGQADLIPFGWWCSIIPGDFDQDGDEDFIIGNMGENQLFKPNRDQAAKVYYSDFDKNGTAEPIITYFNQGIEVVKMPRDLLISQIPVIKKRFPNYKSYAVASLLETFREDELSPALEKKVEYAQSIYLENLGDLNFNLIPLPIEAQFSPILDGEVIDVNQDGYLDLVYVGNDYGMEVQSGRQDASLGGVLMFDPNVGFKFLSSFKSGLTINGNVKSINKIKLASGDEVFFNVLNRDKALIYKSK
jgi:enediyne biosynthesis protein E4